VLYPAFKSYSPLKPKLNLHRIEQLSNHSEEIECSPMGKLPIQNFFHDSVNSDECLDMSETSSPE
jgi:hypothetical protein